MINLNFSNIEGLIFYERDIQNKLPVKYFSIFEQWRLGKKISFLRDLSKNAVLDLLNQLEDSDIRILEDHFGEKIFVEKLNVDITKHVKFKISDLEDCNVLCEIQNFNNLTSYRDKDHIYISFWK